MTTLEMLLMQYAAGALPPSEALMVVAHMSLNPESHRKVRQYEAMGGHMICETAPATMNTDCLDAIFSKIDSRTGYSSACTETKSAKALPGIPDTVAALICGSCTGQNWRWHHMTSGIDKIDLVVCASEPLTRKLRLMRMAPRQAPPRHTHTGTEIMLVLDGSYTDEFGTFQRGDISILSGPATAHSPVAGENGCICLTLTEAPLRFENLLQRLLNIFLRI